MNQQQENKFFDIFREYFNLETNTGRKYSPEEYTLARMKPIAEAAGFPDQSLKIIHIAGTKGKGSTCLYLSALLASAGHKTGAFTSPHLLSVRERFCINAEPCDYETMLQQAAAFEEILRKRNLKPTLFEIMTILSMLIFKAEACEYCILETGIGGTLDATNYIESPVCTGITSISLDHTQLLGNTIEEIAAQKAGIIKRNIPVVCADQPFPEADKVLCQTADRQNAEYIKPRHIPPEWAISNIPDFMKSNFRTAYEICRTIGIVPARKTFQQPSPPGRFQTVSNDPLVIIDSAHNRNSASELTRALKQHFPDKRFTIILGVVKGKDCKGILEELSQTHTPLIITNPHTGKLSAIDELIPLAEVMKLDYSVIHNLHSKTQLPPGPLLFTGSFFTALIGAKLVQSSKPPDDA